jgi:hypothetical protein
MTRLYNDLIWITRASSGSGASVVFFVPKGDVEAAYLVSFRIFYGTVCKNIRQFLAGA